MTAPRPAQAHVGAWYTVPGCKILAMGLFFGGVLMKRMVLVALLLLGASFAAAGDGSNYTRKEDVVYGRKFGTALTMDVFEPKNDKNGVGLIMVVSGGWVSAHELINPPLVDEFIKRG